MEGKSKKRRCGLRYVRDEGQAALVVSLAASGVPQAAIAARLGIGKTTLCKFYARELKGGIAKGGRPPHQWNESKAEVVRALSSYGIKQDDIALHLGIDDDTLRKHYKRELKEGAIEAHTKVAKRIFQMAMEGNVPCLLFWAKTRMGWRETNRIDITSEDGSMAPSKKVQIEFVNAVKKLEKAAKGGRAIEAGRA